MYCPEVKDSGIIASSGSARKQKPRTTQMRKTIFTFNSPLSGVQPWRGASTRSTSAAAAMVNSSNPDSAAASPQFSELEK